MIANRRRRASTRDHSAGCHDYRSSSHIVRVISKSNGNNNVKKEKKRIRSEKVSRKGKTDDERLPCETRRFASAVDS